MDKQLPDPGKSGLTVTLIDATYEWYLLQWEGHLPEMWHFCKMEVNYGLRTYTDSDGDWCCRKCDSKLPELVDFVRKLCGATNYGAKN